MSSAFITVQDTFSKPYFVNRFHLIAGKDGLHNKISHVSVMEVPDFAKHDLGQNLFVLTTFSFCKDNESKMIEILKSLIKKNISGILVKLNRFITRLPDEVIQIANRSNFPIYTIEDDIPFREIITEISKNIINDQYDTIELMNAMYKNLYNSLINKVTLEEFIEKLQIQPLIQYYVFTNGQISYNSNPDNSLDIETIHRILDEFNQKFSREKGTFEEYYELVFQDKKYMIFPIAGARNNFGKIIVEIKDIPITSFNKMAFTQLAGYLSIKLARNKLSLEEKLNTNSRIYSDIIGNPSIDNVQAMNLLHSAGFGNYNLFRILHISIDVSSYASIEQLKNNNPNIFYSESKEMFISSHSHGFSIIFGLDNKNKERQAIIEYFIDQLKIILKKEKLIFKIGVSNEFDDYGKLSIAHDQGKMTTFISKRLGQYDQTNYYHDLWEVDMIRQLTTLDKIEEIRDKVILPLIEYDKSHQLDLLGTLEACIQEESLKKVAENLYIHITTLRYRLGRIQILTGYDFLTNKGRFILTCAFFIYMLDMDSFDSLILS